MPIHNQSKDKPAISHSPKTVILRTSGLILDSEQRVVQSTEILVIPISLTRVWGMSPAEIVFDVSSHTRGALAAIERLTSALRSLSLNASAGDSNKLYEISFDGKNFLELSEDNFHYGSIAKHRGFVTFRLTTLSVSKLKNTVEDCKPPSSDEKDFIICALREKQKSEFDRTDRLIEKIKDMD
jgi:hypothetical protein